MMKQVFNYFDTSNLNTVVTIHDVQQRVSELIDEAVQVIFYIVLVEEPNLIVER